jgi:putative addiction module killer protein
MKVDHGPGYRLYFTYDGPQLVVLLVGGDKGSQHRDISKARRLLELKEWRK